MYEPEFLEVMQKAPCMDCSINLLSFEEHFVEEQLNVADGTRTLRQQVQDGDGRGVQQVRIPRCRIKDDGLVSEVEDSDPARRDEATN
jgi:hypothetical protein